jgi:autotransporter strand-loop-strand O-heptosyltransferase
MNQLGCPNDFMSTDAVSGLKYSFNYGCEIKTPKELDEIWTIKLYNVDTGDILIDIKLPPGGYFTSPVKYYIKWKIEASCKTHVFTHVFDCTDRYVMFKMTHKTLGDCIAYMSQVQRFVELHKCKPVIYAQTWFNELFKDAYPDYMFCDDESQFDTLPLYATYFLGILFDKKYQHEWNKVPYQQCGLQDIAGNILGLDTHVDPEPPHVLVTKNLERDKPYVAISYSGSKACKLWWNPFGWEKIIDYLKCRGFDVVCIDKERCVGMPGSFYHKPSGVIDLTGDMPLQERVNQISGAAFFIGMASGLSWLAWACRKPVIMISGFSRPEMEFYTPYRVYNEENLCNDCWGDTTIPFYHHAWDWCPRVDEKVYELDKRVREAPSLEERSMILHERDEEMAKKFSCTLNINSARVIKTIEQVIKDNNLCEQ